MIVIKKISDPIQVNTSAYNSFDGGYRLETFECELLSSFERQYIYIKKRNQFIDELYWLSLNLGFFFFGTN